jgi:ABC-2 type transport system permease protein
VTDLRVVAVQARFQLTTLARSRRAVVLGFVFPVVLLVMFNSVFIPHDHTIVVEGETITAHAYFTAAMLAYAILGSGFTQLGIGLVSQREGGRLKRLRGTPMPSWTFVVATLLRVVATVALMAVVLLAIGRLAYDVPLSAAALAQIALYVVLGTAAMCSLGIAASTVVTDIDSASAALPFIAVLLAFISGIFVSVDQLPAWLEHLGRLFPVYHLAAGLQTALGTADDAPLDAGNVAALGVWTLGGIAWASRRFRWEPQAVRT